MNSLEHYFLKFYPTSIKHLLSFIALLLIQVSNSQTFDKNQQITLNSSFLNEKREITVLLPNDYKKEEKYPVIYITDADFNFEIAASYLTQLIKFDVIPKSILVGVIPKDRNNELDISWSNNSIKFRDFLINELVSFIDRDYSTTGFNAIIGHSNGAEYNHLLMLEEDNPFRAFINISESLNLDVKKELTTFFSSYTGNKIFLFIASGRYDYPSRIEDGQTIAKIYNQDSNNHIAFQHRLYEADHQTVLAKSLLDGLMHIFKDYRNLFEYENFRDYNENYKNHISSIYGFKPKDNEDDLDYFFGKILDDKDIAMYEYIIHYTTSNNIFEFRYFDMAWHYLELEEYSKSIEYWNKAIENFEKENTERLFFFNFKAAVEAYLIEDDPVGAIKYLEKCKGSLPEYALPFNYFIAKTAFENNVKKTLGKKALKFCKQNFTENIYFEEEDLSKLNSLK